MTYLVSRNAPGVIRNAGTGDVLLFIPTPESIGRYWDAIGCAVMRGAELRILEIGKDV
jgi:hypothetical protein